MEILCIYAVCCITLFQWRRDSIIGNDTTTYPIAYTTMVLSNVISSYQDLNAAAETASVGLAPAFDGSLNDLNFLEQFQVYIYYNNSSTTGRYMNTNIIAIGI